MKKKGGKMELPTRSQIAGIIGEMERTVRSPSSSAQAIQRIVHLSSELRDMVHPNHLQPKEKSHVLSILHSAKRLALNAPQPHVYIRHLELLEKDAMRAL